MTDQVRVTRAQRLAARMIIERSERDGVPVRESIRKIADAQPIGTPTDKQGHADLITPA